METGDVIMPASSFLEVKIQAQSVSTISKGMSNVSANASIFSTLKNTDAHAVRGRSTLRTFALIVHAHPYCTRNSCGKVMPRQPSSVRAEEER